MIILIFTVEVILKDEISISGKKMDKRDCKPDIVELKLYYGGK